MKIAIATHPTFIRAKSEMIDEGQTIYRDGVWMERAHRQIIAAIEAHEDPDDLKDYMERESLLVDALHFEFPEYAAAVTDAFEDHLLMLKEAQKYEAKKAESKQTELPQFNGISF